MHTSLSIREMVKSRSGEQFKLHEEYMNHQFVKVLRTIGFNRNYVRAKGQYLYDEQGNEYLDMLSGYGVFAMGRNHPQVIAAIKEVLDLELPNMVQMDCGLMAGILAERLLKEIPFKMEKVFFSNSGAEAVEGAIKFAKAATGRTEIVYCDSAFHGLTNGAVSLNGCEIFRESFAPFLPGCIKIPFNNLEALEEALRRKSVAAFVVEPIQGKGVHIGGPNYLSEAARLCKKYGTLLVVDEVQTGLGRTGKFLAIEHWNTEADIVTLSKALSGGAVPVGAILTKKWIWDKVFDRMDRSVAHSSTFSKNNLAMAAGLASLEVIKNENLVERARVQGEKLLNGLKELQSRYEFVHEVRGKGMMIGMQFGPPKKLGLKTGWYLLEKANKGLFCQMITIPLFTQHRILTQVAGHNSYVVKMIPPLTLTDEDIYRTVHAFDQVLSEAHQFPGAIWSLATNLASSSFRRTEATV